MRQISFKEQGWLTTAEAAEHLKISEAYLGKLTEHGAKRPLKCYKLGHARMFRIEDLDQYRAKYPYPTPPRDVQKP